MIELVLFYLAILIGVFFIINALSFVRMKMGNTLYHALIVQPYGSAVISKNYLLALAFLETPVILTVVIGILSSDFFWYHSFYLIYMPALYVLIFSMSAAISIYSFGKHLGSFISLFGDHPQFESKFMMQFFVLISTIQAPFIIFFVGVIYHKYFLLTNLECFYLDDGFYFFTIALFLMLLIIQFALSHAISSIILLLKKIYVDYPYHVSNLFLLLIMQMGFLQAPYIFSFIIFIILCKIFYIKFYFLYYVFGILALLFALCASTVVVYSGRVVALVLDKVNFDLKKSTSLMKFALFSQILLDSRILYILLIILFGINFF